MEITWPVGDPSRVVVAGDWHGNQFAARNALIAAKDTEASLVLQLGDFGLWPGPAGVAYLDALERDASAAGVPIAWIDGNHEDFDQLLALPVDPVSGLRQVREHVWHIPRASWWTWHGVRFVAFGGATSLDRGMRRAGVSWWPQESVTDEDLAAVRAVGPCDVLLTHDCPAGVDIPGIAHRSYADARFWPIGELERAWEHRDLMAEAVRATRPGHLWHGHFHTRYSAVSVLHDGPPVRVEGLADDGAGPLANLIAADLSDGQVIVHYANEGLARDDA